MWVRCLYRLTLSFSSIRGMVTSEDTGCYGRSSRLAGPASRRLQIRALCDRPLQRAQRGSRGRNPAISIVVWLHCGQAWLVGARDDFGTLPISQIVEGIPDFTFKAERLGIAR